MTDPKPIRYAVLGLGHISQVAVLPAFANADGCELAALVSGDATKRRVLGERYEARALGYDGYDDLLTSGDVDAVYVATPNHLHADHAIRAARAGVHVLCEKPMAVTAEECQRMIEAADEHEVRLMIAYRLHFDAANLEVVRLVQEGRIGDPRFFVSAFSQSVKEGDIRLNPIAKGGGSVYDMGTYCLNAARYLFRDEPTAVVARSASRDDERFAECDEMTSATLEFPGDRLATFTSSFGAADVESYRIVGTEGDIRMDPSYSYAVELAVEITAGGETERRTFPKRDQFGPELLYFAECIREGREPEPGGREGLADVRAIEAIYEAARTGRRVEIPSTDAGDWPAPEQAITRPGFPKPEEVHASGPSD